MAEKRLPFYMKSHECPACGAAAEHRQFRNRTYFPATVESDSHVLTYTWNDPLLVQIHPPLYFLYFCTSCYFTAASENYIDPSNVLYNRVGIRAYTKARSEKDTFIELLGGRIDYDNITFESALWMHLLAIYTQLLREAEMRDHYTIARLYLRVAWLFREENLDKKNDNTTSPTQDTPEEITKRAVQDALRHFDAVLHQGHEGRDQILAALKADAPRREAKDADTYSKALDTIERLFEALHSETYRLKSTFSQSYTSTLSSGKKSYDAAFLDEVKKRWVYAPVEETEALRCAVEHFEKAIASDSRLNDSEPYFRTAALIIDLELRCNDLDAAFKKVRGIIASVMKDRQAILARIQQTEEPSHKMDLQKKLTSANRSIERATDLHHDIVELVIEREKPKISAILADHTQSTLGQKKVALLANGISHGIIDHLQKKKAI